jgi:hypothetical protein
MKATCHPFFPGIFNILWTVGPEWKERKRFFLRSLKDFGFGSKSEETVLEEASQLSQHILNLTQAGQDYLVKGPSVLFLAAYCFFLTASDSCITIFFSLHISF